MSRFSRLLTITVLSAAILLVPSSTRAWAQEGLDPAAVMTVPYRLATVSGEEVEMRVQYTNRYKEVVRTDYDITVPKPDGASTLELTSAEGKKIVLTLDIKDNTVLSTKVDTDARPAAGENAVVLSLASRSGEGLYFIFQFSGGTVTGVACNSSRTGYVKP